MADNNQYHGGVGGVEEASPALLPTNTTNTALSHKDHKDHYFMSNNNNDSDYKHDMRDDRQTKDHSNGVRRSSKRQSGGHRPVRISMPTMEADQRSGVNGGGEHSVTTRTSQCSCNQGGCGPLLANNLAYFGATATFMFAVNVSFLPKAPFPVIGNALLQEMWLPNQDVAILVPLLLWCLHFLRRFTEVLFVHRYTRTMPYGESLGASVYYWGFGFWIGYSANTMLDYWSPTWYLLIPGIVLYAIGEGGNFLAHIMLARLRGNACHLCQSETPRPSRGNHRIMPNTWMFRLVSCPNYTFEIITWLGYGLAVFTLPAAIFFLASVLTLVIYGYKKHKAYKAYFNGTDGRPIYPPRRKAIIPFIF